MKRIFLLTALCLSLACAKSTSLEEMIAQMIVIGFDGTKESDKWVEQVAKDIKREKIGGVFLTEKNIQNVAQLKKLTDYLKAQAPADAALIVAVEHDGSDANLFSLKKGFAPAYGANEIATSKDVNETASIYDAMCSSMAKGGVNVNLAPVLDLQRKIAGNAKESERSYASYEEIVTTYALLFIDAMYRNGMTPVVKYFPYAGANLWDDFSSRADASASWRFEQLKPYYDLIAYDKIDAVLMSHAKINDLDPKEPSLFSKTIIQNLLRDKMHFKGVVFVHNLRTDSLPNTLDFKQRVIRSVQAGGDILVFTNYFADNASMPFTVQKILLDAVRSGEISQASIEQSYARILTFKKNLSKRGSYAY
ncbi:glycoside hydrolase family 3 N-terminal domain-containing protein [Sulfurospirillum sp. hDNRA2]|nr:glycoside hydrolase family 3 N-terminal domain-containing protein [Sulfurospirillum sp. DNRA8]MCD8544652.1 glycoside hydrolase family 3 protein [Sulfurospirillum cavolei]MCP3651311.1 glycoside hydrolase family 3 protein [Sulfurospirillum sp. DNRA8]MCR1810158.1 glycoside hydrolase family 3 protein [Sulfurospirillum sp. DNRA8]